MGRADDEGEIPYDFLDRDARRRRLAEESRRADFRHKAKLRQKKEALKRSRSRRLRLFVLALLLTFTCAAKLYAHNYTLTTYSVGAEESRNGLEEAEIIAFRKGALVLFRDSVSYLEEGKTLWTENLSFTDPVCVLRGDYFALFERNGSILQIFGDVGLLSTITMNRRIRTADISENGVTAVVTESEEAAYISYFDRFGSRISVELRSLIEATGYPMDIAISPDGQRLAVAYYTLKSGLGESHMVVYDFAEGRESQGYVVAELNSFRETDTLILDVAFLSNDTLVTVGNDRMTLLLVKPVGTTLIAERSLSENTRAVFFEADCLAVAESIDTGTSLVLYNAEGKVVNTMEVPCGYGEIHISSRQVIFRDGARLILVNRNGRMRYDGELTDSPKAIVFSGGTDLLINTGSVLRTITLK